GSRQSRKAGGEGQGLGSCEQQGLPPLGLHVVHGGGPLGLGETALAAAPLLAARRGLLAPHVGSEVEAGVELALGHDTPSFLSHSSPSGAAGRVRGRVLGFGAGLSARPGTSSKVSTVPQSSRVPRRKVTSTRPASPRSPSSSSKPAPTSASSKSLSKASRSGWRCRGARTISTDTRRRPVAFGTRCLRA